METLASASIKADTANNRGIACSRQSGFTLLPALGKWQLKSDWLLGAAAFLLSIVLLHIIEPLYLRRVAFSGFLCSLVVKGEGNLHYLNRNEMYFF